MSNEHVHPLIQTILDAIGPAEQPYALELTFADQPPAVKEFKDWLSCDRAFYYWSCAGYKVKWIRGPRDGAPVLK